MRTDGAARVRTEDDRSRSGRDRVWIGSQSTARCTMTPSHAQGSPHRVRIQRQVHALSAHDQRPGNRPSGHGKGEASVGISKVPDARLDKLTAMYNPRKKVPATVEFTDLALPAGTGGAQALVDVAAYKNADALVHVLRAFQDPSVPHPSGSVDPARDAQAMEDELILADLGVVERRLERLEKDLKKGRTPELERERDVLMRVQGRARRGPAAARAGPDGRRSQAAARLPVPLGKAAAHRHQPGRIAARGRRRSTRAAAATGLSVVPVARVDGRRRGLREDRARDRAARGRGRGGVSHRPRAGRVGTESRDSRQLRSAGLHVVFHRRRGRVPRMVDSARHAGAARGRRNPQRHRARLHPRRGRRLRSL